jgi:UTP--glucose-1-phosphate uridylyltransferase
MRPLTTAIPKEMLPVGNIPIIEHTVLELIASGIKRVCIVISRSKEVIQEYFNKRKALYKKVELHFAHQKVPLGLGDAIRRAKGFIGEIPFIMAIPDQILLSSQPASKQLLDAWKKREGIWNSMVKIPKKEMHFFKGSRPFKCRRAKRGFYFIDDISTDETSLIRGFGRTIFLPEAFEYMTEEFMNDQTGEVDLLKTFQALKNRFPLYGMVLEGRPCDIGTWEGYYFYQPRILNYLNSNPFPPLKRGRARRRGDSREKPS